MTTTRQRMPATERREAVLAAAVTEFAARGLAGTSTEDVARRAGISQPYLFRLFPTKKALFLALVERCFHRGGRRPDRRRGAGGHGRFLYAPPRRPDPAPAADADLRRLQRPRNP